MALEECDPGSSGTTIDVVFFDLGDTLVRNGRAWVPGAKELIAELRSKDVALGVISNTGDLSRDELLELLPEDFSFDVFQPHLVLLSSEIGYEKPDVRVFLEATRRAGGEARTCLFCTENLTHTLAAQQASMYTVRIGMLDPDLQDIVPSLTSIGMLSEVS